jgi:hypothetical protein
MMNFLVFVIEISMTKKKEREKMKKIFNYFNLNISIALLPNNVYAIARVDENGN